MALMAHRAWLMATFCVRDDQVEIRQTLCFGREKDLLDRVQVVPEEPLAALVFMSPPWQARRGTWTSHSVRRIWSARDTQSGSELLLFETNHGIDLLADPRYDSTDSICRTEVVLQIPTERSDE